MNKKKHTSNTLTISVDHSSSTESKKRTNSITKKIEKIEQLKKQLQKMNDTVAIAKKLFDEHCGTKEKELLERRESFLIKLYERFQQKGFALWQKELMEGRLLNDIEELMYSGYESEALLAIRDQINEAQIQNMDGFEKEMMNDMAKDFLKNMGVHVDEEDFNFEDFANPDFRDQFNKKHFEREQQQHQEFHEEFNNEKHRVQKEKVKGTNTDFQKLYKSLVKKAHPDLVLDPAEKEVREEWMKRLSQAWEERNYYQLLVLQKEIGADHDSEDIALSESQVQPLILELNKEIQKLEHNKYLLKYQNPDTAFYFEKFNARSEKGVLKKIIAYKDLVELKIDGVEEERRSLKTQKSTKELLKEIRDMQSGMFDDPFGMFDFFE